MRPLPACRLIDDSQPPTTPRCKPLKWRLRALVIGSPAGPGHHRLHFEAARIALGPSAQGFLDYFEISRRKRNVIDYDYAFVATETEAQEILNEAKAFSKLVGRWIELKYPSFV
jgi:hypothetical protein